MKAFFLISSRGLEIGLVKLGQCYSSSRRVQAAEGGFGPEPAGRPTPGAEMVFKLQAQIQGELIWRKLRISENNV